MVCNGMEWNAMQHATQCLYRDSNVQRQQCSMFVPVPSVRKYNDVSGTDMNAQTIFYISGQSRNYSCSCRRQYGCPENVSDHIFLTSTVIQFPDIAVVSCVPKYNDRSGFTFMFQRSLYFGTLLYTVLVVAVYGTGAATGCTGQYY